MMAWGTLAHDAIADRRLIEPFTARVGTGTAYWLVSSARIPLSTEASAFGDWIRTEFVAGTVNEPPTVSTGGDGMP